MATFNKIQDYVEQLNKAKHDWTTHVFKAMLTNSAPIATNTVKADLTDITAANGYPAGGMTLDTVTLTETTGTAKVTIADEVLTASGGTIGPFRYVAIYNDTATSPADALVMWYDYASAITLNDGESFTIDFDASAGFWTMA